MFSIFDGRKHFYQWDTGQRLIVNKNVCSEVHFCNGMDDCALICEIYEENGQRLVNVPNILLQSAEIIRVFAVVRGCNGKHTRRSQAFVVFGRTKPANYVYTETEIKTWAKLEKKIDKKLDANQGTENAGRAMVVGDDGIVRPGDYAGGGAITPGIENAGKLLYVEDDGNVAFLQLGAGLEILNGRLCIIGTVTPDEPDVPDEPDDPDEPAEAITFTQTGENSVTVIGVVFERQEDGTVLWRGATFAPGEGNTVIIS